MSSKFPLLNRVACRLLCVLAVIILTLTHLDSARAQTFTGQLVTNDLSSSNEPNTGRINSSFDVVTTTTNPATFRQNAMSFSSGLLTNFSPQTSIMDSRAFDINDAGVIVGSAQNVNSPNSRISLLRYPNGTLEQINPPAGQASSSLNILDINNVIPSPVFVGMVAANGPGQLSSAVAGVGPFTFDLNAINPAPPPKHLTIAAAVNDSLVAVGVASNSAYTPDYQAFKYDLFTNAYEYLYTPAGDSSQALAINGYGMIVGGVHTPGGLGVPPAQVPSVWNGSVLTILPLPPGATSGIAYTISDLGWIGGSAYFPATGEFQAVLWAPITLRPTVIYASSVLGINLAPGCETSTIDAIRDLPTGQPVMLVDTINSASCSNNSLVIVQ